jgi:hypothetical protein
MLIVDLIRESFDSEVPYTVVRAGNDWFTTRANINGRMITFNAASYSTANGYNWEIDFSEKSSQSGTTFAKTGNGGEMQVFSFVIASIKELIARYAPAAIEFASHKADGNRSKLYQRMLSRIPLPGYHVAATANSDESADDFFRIEKD